MTAVFFVRHGVSLPQRWPAVIVLVCIPAWWALPAHGQVGRRAGDYAVAGAGDAMAAATSQIVSDAIVGSALGPFYLFAQIAECFDEMFRTALHLPQAQIDRIREINAEMAAKIDALKGLSVKERREKMLAMLPELEKEYVARIEKVLDADQRVQFRQLVNQLRGASALVEPDVAMALQLTEEQSKELAVTLADYNKRIQDAVSDGEEPGVFKIAEVTNLRKRRDHKLLAVLTPEQTERWGTLKGKSKIDVEALLRSIASAHIANLTARSKAALGFKPLSPEEKLSPPQSPPPPAPPAPSAPKGKK